MPSRADAMLYQVAEKLNVHTKKKNTELGSASAMLFLSLIARDRLLRGSLVSSVEEKLELVHVQTANLHALRLVKSRLDNRLLALL